LKKSGQNKSGLPENDKLIEVYTVSENESISGLMLCLLLIFKPIQWMVRKHNGIRRYAHMELDGE
jgi:hypothetical protein